MALTSTSRIQEVIASFKPRSYIVKEGDYVVIEENREKKSLQLIRATGPTMLELFTPTTHTSKNNSELQDKNETNQQLRKNDIESMKKEGKAGAEIVGALVSNSATFETKTEFSQDKYKLKKAKKYCTYISIQRPTAATVCQLFFDKNTQRVWSLRADSMSILLSLANVGAYAKVLVLESCLGVVTAAAAERLGGHGRLCAASTDAERGVPLDAVQYLNFGEQQKKAICTASLQDLLAAKQRCTAAGASGHDAAAPADAGSAPQPAAAAPSDGAAHPAAAAAAATDGPSASTAGAAPATDGVLAAERNGQDGGEHPTAMESEGGAGDAGAGLDGVAEAGCRDAAMVEDGQEGAGGSEGGTAGPSRLGAQRYGQGGAAGRRSYAASPEDLAHLVGSGFTSCIIAAPKLHPRAVIERVLPLLAPSAAFVLYSPWMQPLAEAMHHLQSSRLAVMLQLHESWLRDYQVLPGRSHPEMSMTGTGGYILSGIKIQAEEARPTAPTTTTQAAADPGVKRHAEDGGVGGRGAGGRGAGGKRFRSR